MILISLIKRPALAPALDAFPICATSVKVVAGLGKVNEFGF